MQNGTHFTINLQNVFHFGALHEKRKEAMISVTKMRKYFINVQRMRKIK